MKDKKKLIILDISSNLKIERKNCYVIKIDTGNITLENYKDLTFNLNIKKYNFYYNKIISTQILLYLKKFTKFLPLKYLLYSEIANFRDDKINLFDKVKCILEIKRLHLDKKYNIEVISDKKYAINIYFQLFKKFRFYNAYKNENKNINFRLKYFLSRTRFLFKVLFITSYLKLFFKKNYLGKQVGFSIYPIMNIGFKNRLYKVKNPKYLNFLIGDETHTDTNLFTLIKKIQNLSKKNFFHAEQELLIKDLVFDYLISLKKIGLIKEIEKKNLIINKIDFKTLFQHYFLISLLNLLKIKIYEKPLIKIFKNRGNFKEFHYFLFEYNLGFFMTKTIKSINSKIRMIGYQHGIFGENTPWLEIINKSKINNFMPDKILYVYEETKKIYQKKISAIFRKNSCNFDNLNKKLIPIIDKANKNCLIFLGLHDGEDIINQILYDANFRKKFNKIYLKYHPKKTDIISKYNKKEQLNFVNNLEKIKVGSIYLSSSSSLTYAFKKMNISFNLINIPYKSSKK
tara:strand:+ start:8789 stop:10330 length:1542 start_codon:yes stop_codon:yes gene_type:complete